MERDAFELLTTAEADHWWFKGRRVFIRAAFQRLALRQGARVLDAGCGSGGNLALLREFGEPFGFEYDQTALAAAQQRGIGTVTHGSLPDGIPFPDERFDAVGLFDVLEHLEQPALSLSAIRARLVPGGAVVLTVPANPWLWGPHDVTHHHYRRYTARSLRADLVSAGLEVEYLSYFNSLLLPLAILQRAKERVVGYRADEVTPSPGLNRLLFRIWHTERRWIPNRQLPFGLSLIAIARNGRA